jgi:acyl carrier protein
VDNTVFYVLSGDKALVPFGCVGELYIGGAGLARGYLNRPQLSESCFIDNPYYDEGHDQSSKRLYRTGDLVRYLPDGNLAFVGRSDFQVKVRGYRIEPGEIEAQLSRLPSVDSARVFVEDIAGTEQLVGYVKPVQLPDTAQVAEYINGIKQSVGEQLPNYMVPGIVMLVEQWPLTPSGKLDKQALPAPDGSLQQREYIAPQTQTETTMVNIWSSLLNIDAEAISTSADFFELGGSSLLIIRMLSLIKQQLNITLDVQQLYQIKDIQQLAGLCDSLRAKMDLEARLSERDESELEEVEF